MGPLLTRGTSADASTICVSYADKHCSIWQVHMNLNAFNWLRRYIPDTKTDLLYPRDISGKRFAYCDGLTADRHIFDINDIRLFHLRLDFSTVAAEGRFHPLDHSVLRLRQCRKRRK